MPNIFDGLKKISDEEIIEQIALLENINMINISKPIAQKAKKKTINLINFIGNKIGKNQIIKEPEVKEIWTLIDEAKDDLKEYTRIELDERLLNVLMEKSKNDIEDPSEDDISIKIIEEAAKLYKFYKSSTPGQKANNIYSKYCEKLKGQATEYVKEQQLIELKEKTEVVEETLKNMDKEKKNSFEQSINVENLTLLNAWRNVDRQLFAKIVWLAVKAYEGRFTPTEEMLPSFVENEEEAEAINQEKDLREAQEGLLEIKNKLELYEEKITTAEKSLQEKSSLLNNAIKNKSQAENDIVNLAKMNDKLEKIKKLQDDKLKELKEQVENAALESLDSLMEEYKKVKFDGIDINNKNSDISIDITYKNQLIEDTIAEIASNKEAIEKIGTECKEAKIEIDILIKIYNEKKVEVFKKEENKRNEIFRRWSEFFNKFTFEFKELSTVVGFTREELLHVEECLYELHFTKNPMSFSIGLISDKTNKDEKEEYPYVDICFPDKFKVEIQYKVLNGEEKKVKIIEITTKF